MDEEELRLLLICIAGQMLPGFEWSGTKLG
jgi:hypothetical protein